jgi:hypothetical protein
MKHHRESRTKLNNDKRKAKPDYAEKQQAYAKKRWQKPEIRLQSRTWGRQRQRRLQQRVSHHMGGNVLVVMNLGRIEFLAIDHMNGAGAQHRRSIGKGGTVLYSWLVRQHFPEGFQVLCHNCS